MQKSTRNKILGGCGIILAFLILAALIGGYLAFDTFVRFGIKSDLTDYRDAILQMELAEETKNSLVADLDALYDSVDRDNNFELLNWVDRDSSITVMLEDGELTESEVTALKSEIARLKEIQGLTEP